MGVTTDIASKFQLFLRPLPRAHKSLPPNIEVLPNVPKPKHGEHEDIFFKIDMKTTVIYSNCFLEGLVIDGAAKIASTAVNYMRIGLP